MAVKYTKEILEEAVRNSNSTSDVVRYLKMKESGGSHRHIKQRLMFYNIDISHFTSNKTFTNQKPPTRYSKTGYSVLLVKNETGNRIHAKYLRLALEEAGVEEKCSDCGNGIEWNGKPIQLQIDHINGDGLDNRLENLRYLCPNCHSQTETFGSRNPNKTYLTKHLTKPKPKPEIRKERKARKTLRPPKDILEKLVWEKPTTHIAKEYGVSDKAVEKWCKVYSISKPPRGYWAKRGCDV